LPGGLVDIDEEPVDAAIRELEEETGYRAGDVEHLATYQPMPGAVDAEHSPSLAGIRSGSATRPT
jgi:8-oxo-dGTP pyrophosphatase MutT (NUDIX family)